MDNSLDLFVYVLYMFCLCLYAVPCEEEASVPLPEGLALVEDFVSPEEEALLLAAIDWSSANDDVTGEGLRNLFLPVCFRCLSSG